MNEKYTAILSLLIMTIIMTACGGEFSNTKNNDSAETSIAYSQDSVEGNNDLKTVVDAAFNLSDLGRHSDSAETYLKALQNFSSINNGLEETLLSAAICEYYEAGMIDEVREQLAALDSYRLNLSKNAKDNSSIENIRKILTQHS